MRKLTMQELNRLPVDDFKATPKSPVVLVLDNVRSLHNVGAVFRTADAFALEHIYLCGVTGQPPHREITKTALGSTESVAWTHTPTTLEAAQQLQAAGYQLVAVEQTTGSVPLPQFRPTLGARWRWCWAMRYSASMTRCWPSAKWLWRYRSSAPSTRSM